MPPLEPDLRRVLRRKPAPAGLTERILSHLPSEVRPQPRWHPARLRLAWSLTAAALLCLTLGGVFANHYRIERRNEAARQQLVESLRLAGHQIARAESRAFTGSAWERMKARLEQIETSAADGAATVHSPTPPPRI
jgi:hypothetical protein